MVGPLADPMAALMVDQMAESTVERKAGLKVVPKAAQMAA